MPTELQRLSLLIIPVLCNQQRQWSQHFSLFVPNHKKVPTNIKNKRSIQFYKKNSLEKCKKPILELDVLEAYQWAVSRFCWFTCTKSTNTSDVFNRNLGTFKRNPPVMYSICTHHTLHTHEEHSIPVCTINGNIRSNNYNKNLHLWKDHREIWQLPYLKFFTWPYDFNPSIDL